MLLRHPGLSQVPWSLCTVQCSTHGEIRVSLGSESQRTFAFPNFQPTRQRNYGQYRTVPPCLGSQKYPKKQAGRDLP